MDTQELYNYLQETFEYRDGGLYYKKSPNRKIPLGKRAGHANKDNYIAIGINKKVYKAHRLIFLYHKGYLPKTIDHIDRNPLNNKIENLREINISNNALNRGKNKTNKSGYKGVSYHKESKKWRAQTMVNYKKIHIGSFNSPEIAYQAYCEFVKTNFPIHCLE